MSGRERSSRDRFTGQLSSKKAGQRMHEEISDGDERLRIACLTSFDPHVPGKNSWSHTARHLAVVLTRHGVEMTSLGPMDATFERAAGKMLDMGYMALCHQHYMYFHSQWVARRFGRVGTYKLARAGQHFDAVLALGAVDVAYLASDLPIVLVLDATHRLVRDYYAAYSHLTARSQRELDTIERVAIQRAALVLVSSTWAARSVIADYQADPAKVHVLPFGADLAAPPAADVARTRTERCRLLFVATDWQRKGGDLAVETLRALGVMGVDAELVVCGCVPQSGVSDPRLRIIPYLDKRDARQRQEMESLYLNSDFLLLPTRSDCTPIVFCEAAAFGLPVVTTDTGGVSEIVRDGETGFTLPLEAAGNVYAAVIAQAYRDASRHAEMMRASRARYETRLNWDAWARDALPWIAEVAGRHLPSTPSRPAGRDVVAM